MEFKNNFLGSELKESENQIKENEELYRFIAENMNDIISVFDKNFNLIHINDAQQKISGFSKEEVMNKNALDFLHPDDIKDSVKVFQDALKTGSGSAEYRLRCKDGSYIWVESNAKILTDKKGELKAILVTRDINEREKLELQLQRAEEKYRRLLNNISDVLLEVDLTGKFIYISPQVSNMFGYEPQEIIKGKGYKFIHPEDLPVILENLKNSLNSDSGNKVSLEFRILNKAGDYVPVSMKGNILKERNGLFVVGVIRDISKQIELEQARRKYTQDLEKEVKIKTEQLVQSEKLAAIGRLAAGVAHEINNPIMGVINYADIIKEKLKNYKDIDVNSKPFSFLDGIIREGSRIAGIVNELLSYSHKDFGPPEYSDISKVVKSTIALLSSRIKESQINIQFDFQQDLPNIPIITEKMQQVFLNLFQNSIDALNEKFGSTHQENLKKIVIGTALFSKEKEKYVKITIWDNGQGIEKENLEKLFEPFFTTKSQSKIHGTGLGLYISYNIIKLHRGEITVQSEWQNFTKIEILLPESQF